MSRTSENGTTRGEMPSSISASAAAKAWRNSVSVSPPASAASNSPSGLSARRIWMSVPGRSLTNWSASADTTRSSEASRKGSVSSSAATTNCTPSIPSLVRSPWPGRSPCAMLSRTRRRATAAPPASASAAMMVPTFPLAASTRRTASVGVPRSSAHSKRRSTVARRSDRSSATRSIRKVEGPSAAARIRCVRWRRRSKTRGCAETISFSLPRRGRRDDVGSPRSGTSAPQLPATPLRFATCGVSVSAMQGETVPAKRFARLSSALRASFGLVLDVALPQLCPTCREPVDGAGLCPVCWSKLSFIAPPYCERLGIPFPFDGGPGLLSMEAIADPPAHHRARAAVRYDDIARKLVHALKYGDRLDLAPTMGRWMARAGRELLADTDAIVAVPLHWRRQWARRFNQSALLAEIIAKASGRTVAHAALKRVKATPQQVGLDKSERAENVQGAFRVPAHGRAEVAGRRLVLVDDVLTSGATVDACSRALLRAGAASVDVLVFARVVAASRPPI